MVKTVKNSLAYAERLSFLGIVENALAYAERFSFLGISMSDQC